MTLQPGHTAPRDGTPIIGYWKGRTPLHDCLHGIVWRNSVDIPESCAWFEIGDPDWNADDVEHIFDQPHYWMPMPNRDDYEELT
jgi:hypothetical protein